MDKRVLMCAVAAAIVCALALASIVHQRQRQWEQRRQQQQAQQARHRTNVLRALRALRARSLQCMAHEREISEARRAAFLHKMEALASRPSWQGALELGHMLRTGDYPHWAPHDLASRHCFAVASRSPDPVVAREARSMMATPPVSIDGDIAGGVLPVTSVMAAMAAMAATAATADRSTPKQPTPEPKPIAIRSDAQNVHDHAVTASVKNVLVRIGATPGEVGASAGDEVIDWIVSDGEMTEKQKIDAVRVVESLSAREHSAFGVSERGVLQRAWQAAESDGEKKHMIAAELAAAVEDGVVVCSSGKIARIAAALEPERVKPMWAVREEMARMAATVRDHTLPHTSPVEQKGAFRTAATAEYIEGLGMSRDVVDPIIAELEAGFE